MCYSYIAGINERFDFMKELMWRSIKLKMRERMKKIDNITGEISDPMSTHNVNDKFYINNKTTR